MSEFNTIINLTLHPTNAKLHQLGVRDVSERLRRRVRIQLTHKDCTPEGIKRRANTLCDLAIKAIRKRGTHGHEDRRVLVDGPVGLMLVLVQELRDWRITPVFIQGNTLIDGSYL